MTMYKLTLNGVKRLADGAGIPNDPANSDWMVFKEWEKAGNTPLPRFTEQELSEMALAEMKTNLEQINEQDLRVKYDLVNLRDMKIKEIEQYVETTLAGDDGVKKAIRQLTIAVALLSRKLP